MVDTKAFVCAILLLIILFGGASIAGHIEHNYTRKDCEVVEVNGDIVTVEDRNGYLWEFEGTGYDVGVYLDIMMHTNYTHGTIIDDYITGVK